MKKLLTKLFTKLLKLDSALIKKEQQNVIDFKKYLNERNENNIKPFIIFWINNGVICKFNSGLEIEKDEILKILSENDGLVFKTITEENYRIIKLYYDAIQCVIKQPEHIFRVGLFSGKDFIYNGEKNIIEFSDDYNSCSIENIKIRYGTVMNKIDLLYYLKNQFNSFSYYK